VIGQIVGVAGFEWSCSQVAEEVGGMSRDIVDAGAFIGLRDPCRDGLAASQNSRHLWLTASFFYNLRVMMVDPC
jgi:hypothetical protein